jgi:uncharacterized protein (DUF2249 family)/hemerythrin superfamily protein
VKTAQAILLDIRPLPPRERHPLIFKSFDSLADGGEFVLVSDHDPKPLLYQLQEERAGSFDWSVLEEGPEVWRILISRRSPEKGRGRSVNDYLAWDHDRLEAVLAECRSAMNAGSRPEAERRFAEFRTGLLHHIRMEEEVLFPSFDRAIGSEGGGSPTVVMRLEHRQIEAILEGIRLLFASESATADRFERLHAELVSVLADHNAKEEHVVYPLTDRTHPASERDELIKKMQRT